MRTLERMVSMLVALAVLAERAADRSFPVRWLVLSLLRRADQVACAFVAHAVPFDDAFVADAGGIGNEPADAILLGARLRALAAWLAALLAAHLPFRGHVRAVEGGPGRSAALPGWFVLVSAHAGRTGVPYDTS